MTVEFFSDNTDTVGPRLIATNVLPTNQNVDKNSLYAQIRPKFPAAVSHNDWTSWIQDSIGAQYYDKHHHTYMVHHIGNIKSTLDKVGANSNFGAADYLVLDKLGYNNADIAYILDSGTLTPDNDSNGDMLHWQIKHGDPKNWMQTSDSINWADAVAQANASWSSVNSADQNAGGGFGDASSRFITKRNEWYNGATSAINTHNQNTEDSANAAVDYEYNQNLALKTKNTTLNNYDSTVVKAVNGYGEEDYLDARDKVIEAYKDLSNSDLLTATDKLNYHNKTIGALDNLYSTGTDDSPGKIKLWDSSVYSLQEKNPLTGAFDPVYYLYNNQDVEQEWDKANEGITDPITGKKYKNKSITEKYADLDTYALTDYVLKGKPDEGQRGNAPEEATEATFYGEHVSDHDMQIYRDQMLGLSAQYQRDEDGNIIYEDLMDFEGNPVYEEEDLIDAEGNPVYEEDENGNIVEDEDGNPIPVRVLVEDEDGNYVPVRVPVEVEGTKKYSIFNPETGAWDSIDPEAYTILTNEDGSSYYEIDKLDYAGNPIYEYLRDADNNIMYEKDADGKELLDEDGRRIPIILTDDEGNPITEKEQRDVFVSTEYAKKDLVNPWENEKSSILEGAVIATEKRDADGNIIYKTDDEGNDLLDEDGNPIPEMESGPIGEAEMEAQKQFAQISLHSLKSAIGSLKEAKKEETNLMMLTNMPGMYDLLNINENLVNTLMGDTGIGGYLSMMGHDMRDKEGELADYFSAFTGIPSSNSVAYNWQKWFAEEFQTQYYKDYEGYQTVEDVGSLIKKTSEFEGDRWDDENQEFTTEFLEHIDFESTEDLLSFLEDETVIEALGPQYGGSTGPIPALDTLIDDLQNNETIEYEIFATDLNGEFVYEYERDADDNIIYEKDDEGNDLLDEDGNRIPVTKKDKAGNPIKKLDENSYAFKLNSILDDFDNRQGNFTIPLYEEDSEGNIVYKTDENGETIKDEDGNPIPVIQKDENGNAIVYNYSPVFIRSYIEDYLKPRFDESKSMDEFVSYMDVQQDEENVLQTQSALDNLRDLGSRRAKGFFADLQKTNSPVSFDSKFYFDPIIDSKTENSKIKTYSKQTEVVNADWNALNEDTTTFLDTKVDLLKDPKKDYTWRQWAYHYGLPIDPLVRLEGETDEEFAAREEERKDNFAKLHYQVRGTGHVKDDKGNAIIFDPAKDIITTEYINEGIRNEIFEAIEEGKLDIGDASYLGFVTPAEYADSILEAISPDANKEEWTKILEAAGFDVSETGQLEDLEELRDFLIESFRTGAALDIRESIKWLNEQKITPSQKELGVSYIQRPEDKVDAKSEDQTELYNIFAEGGYQGTEDEFYETFFPDADRDEQIYLTKALQGTDLSLDIFNQLKEAEESGDPFAAFNVLSELDSETGSYSDLFGVEEDKEKEEDDDDILKFSWLIDKDEEEEDSYGIEFDSLGMGAFA